MSADLIPLQVLLLTVSGLVRGPFVPMEHSHSPEEHRHESRCDTYPGSRRDGEQVVIDSPHGGDRHQMWTIDGCGE